MGISFQCPQCGKDYSVGDDLAGKKARCKCGQEIVVPEPESIGGTDDMSALLDAELPPAGEELPLGPVSAARSPGSPLQPVAAAPRKSQSGTSPLLWIGIGAAALVGLAAILVLVVFLFSGPKKTAKVADKAAEVAEVAEKAAAPAYASPEDVFRANLKATMAKDWDTQIRLFTPESQEKMAGGMALVASMMAGDNPKMAELMSKHGIDESLLKETSPDAGKPADFVQAIQKKTKALAAAIDDKPAFYVELMNLMEESQEDLTQKLSLPGMDIAKLKEESEQAQKNSRLVELERVGDWARGKQAVSVRGKEHKVPIEFRRIDGSWLLHQPDAGAESKPPALTLPGK